MSGAREYPLTEEGLSVRVVQAHIPRDLPPQWQPRDVIAGQVGYINRKERLSVILSAATKLDGRMWLHCSIAHRDRLPTWDEFTRVKDLFLGPETKAIQILAPRSQWVSIHPFCLHLWVCLDADPVPDFTEGTGSI